MRPLLAMCLRSASLPLVCLLLLACGSQPLLSNDTEDDARRIVEKLGAGPGTVVAEIGGGTGDLALSVARLLGPTAKMYATEIDQGKLPTMRSRVATSKGAPIEALEALADASGLPAGCCDGLYMRDVYHHFTQPEKLVASLFQNLKSGGRLVVIDFRPRTGGTWSVPPGVPANRGGHGITLALLREELEAGGFRHVETIENWRDDLYAVIVEKPR